MTRGIAGYLVVTYLVLKLHRGTGPIGAWAMAPEVQPLKDTMLSKDDTETARSRRRQGLACALHLDRQARCDGDDSNSWVEEAAERQRSFESHLEILESRLNAVEAAITLAVSDSSDYGLSKDQAAQTAGTDIKKVGTEDETLGADERAAYPTEVVVSRSSSPPSTSERSGGRRVSRLSAMMQAARTGTSSSHTACSDVHGRINHLASLASVSPRTSRSDHTSINTPDF